MSSTPEPGANLDASTFDLDSWIDDVVRPEVTIELYPHEAEYAAKVAAIEALIPAAEKTSPENRGLDDPSPEQLLAQIEDLKRERSASALKVWVRQITNDELTDAVARGAAAGWDKGDVALWTIAEACVEPAFTPDQLLRLRKRDMSGESMILQLSAAVVGLRSGLPTPS